LSTERIAAVAGVLGLALLLVASFGGGADAASRFLLQDYGASCFELALSIGLASHRAWFRGRTPKTVWIVFLVGVAAAFLSDLAAVCWWLLERARGLLANPQEFARRIADTRRGFVLLLIVAAFFCVLGAAGFQGRTEIAAAFRRVTRPGSFWSLVFGVPLAMTAVTAAGALAGGYFLFYPPLLLWGCFFAFLFASKRRHVLRHRRPNVGLG
jgi:hypothetical protein